MRFQKLFEKNTFNIDEVEKLKVQLKYLEEYVVQRHLWEVVSMEHSMILILLLTLYSVNRFLYGKDNASPMSGKKRWMKAANVPNYEVWTFVLKF